MAWIKKYQIPFQSFAGTQYMVYIYERGDTQGTVTQLTGAAEPFTTQEDDNDDIFTPIRKQTGYLRVLDETGTLLETLIPANNTEKLVRLYSGTWNAAMTTFTDGTIQWQGFLCAQAYTQPWDNSAKVIEFPVKSVLAAMEDVQISSDYFNSDINLAQFIVEAFNAVGVTPNQIIVGCDLNSDQTGMLKLMVNAGIFFTQTDVVNSGTVTTEFTGANFYDVLSAIASTYGLTFREHGEDVLLMQYDGTTYRILCRDFLWSIFVMMANGTGIGTERYELGVITMSDLTFMGADNVAGFLQGAHKCSVVLNLSEDISLLLDLPRTAESPTPTPSLVPGDGFSMYIQPHNLRSLAVETYYHWKCDCTRDNNLYFSYSEFTSLSPAMFFSLINDVGETPCTEYLPFTNPWLRGTSYYSCVFYLGSYPARFYVANDSSDSPTLQNCMLILCSYINDNWHGGGSVPVPQQYPEEFRQVYAIKTASSIQLGDGYLKIELAADYFMHNGSVLHNEPAGSFILIRIGSEYWNGYSWYTFADDNSAIAAECFVGYENNKPADVDAGAGYYIRINGKSGVMSVSVLSMAKAHSDFGSPYITILKSLSAAFTFTRQITDTDRKENTYMQILEAKFSDAKAITLQIGTRNNNGGNKCLLKNANSEYVTEVAYMTSPSGTYNQRPENHLLYRMTQYYRTVRRTLKGQISNTLAASSLFTGLFSYNSRKYVGIRSSVNWRDDEEEVKFIEVT